MLDQSGLNPQFLLSVSIWKVTFSCHNNIFLFVKHPAALSFSLTALNEPEPPTILHPKPKTGLAFHVSICQWQGLTRTLPFSKGSVCESWIQSCLKQLPQPGCVPLSSSYIFTPLRGMCLQLSWVSVWDKQVLKAVCLAGIVLYDCTVGVLHWS